MVIAFDVTRGRLIMRDRKFPALLPRTTKTLLCKRFSACENLVIAVEASGRPFAVNPSADAATVNFASFASAMAGPRKIFEACRRAPRSRAA